MTETRKKKNIHLLGLENLCLASNLVIPRISSHLIAWSKSASLPIVDIDSMIENKKKDERKKNCTLIYKKT